MRQIYERSAREHSEEKIRHPVKNDYTLWCPFCDRWALADSIVARKKMGLHIANHHHEEVLFSRTEKPPELETV